MAGKHQQIIVLDNTPITKTLATIDPAPYSKLPFGFTAYENFESEWDFRGRTTSIHNGMLVEKETFDSGEVLLLNVYNYQDHNYDIATVLGIMDNIGILDDKKLFIYGKKIGEQVISARSFYRNSTSWGIKPNDELLIRKIKNPDTVKESYEIIHNITHAQKKYEIEQHFSR